VETIQCYLERKHREILLLNGCLKYRLELQKPTSPERAIAQKFRLAAAIKAERTLQNWSITETAWASHRPVKSGGYEFDYRYQRADLRVHGPPIYRALGSPSANVVQETIYASSGMSAMAALLSALSTLCDCAEVLVPNGCYGETLELFDSFGCRLRTLPPEAGTGLSRRGNGVLRAALIDSSVRAGFSDFAKMVTDEIDLVIFDTTCFWRSSAHIRRVVEWAWRSNLPLALVRSHAKLDCLGIEYGRLGSVVIAAPLQGILSGRLKWLTRLIRGTGESIRLLGAAPILANFPPFAADRAFERCTVDRIAAIIRNNRRMVRLLSARLGATQAPASFQHGLYFTLELAGNPPQADATGLANSLCRELESSALPVAHAGSFGFDFIAIDRFADSWSGCNVIRVAASDLPVSVVDRVAEGIAAAWMRHGSASRIDPGSMRKSAAPA
jgi:hypothetical protein